MRNFRELKVWEKAHILTLAVYQSTVGYPKDETYGLTSQTRRAAYSVPTNIAEGCGKDGEADFIRYLEIARGSTSELEYELLLARDLKYLNPSDYETLALQANEIKMMLTGLIQNRRSVQQS
jgi:four helix bundle protein